MSTKHILDQLKTAGGRSSRTRSSPTHGEETRRVKGGRVIVRRKRAKARADAAPDQQEGAAPDNAAQTEIRAGRVRAIRRVAPARAEAPAERPVTPPAVRPAVVAPVEEPSAAEAAVAEEAVPEAAAEAAAAEEVAPEAAAEAAAAEEVAPEAAAEAAAAEESAPEAPAEAAGEAAAEVAAEAAAAEESAPEAATAEVEAAGAPEPAVAAEPAEPAAAEPAADAPREPESAAAALARGLPRADGSRPDEPERARPRFAGLGAAVVRPPPGWDPTDPEGSRRRLQEQNAAATARRKEEAQRPGWRDAERARREEPGARRGRGRRQVPGRRGRVDLMMEDYVPARRRRRKSQKTGARKESPQAKAIKRRVEVDGAITVAGLAHAMSVKASEVIAKLLEMGQVAKVNDTLDIDTARLVASEFGYEVIDASFKEEELLIQVEDAEENLRPRPPIVTVMGHVDHGKTTLLDTIRHANVAAREAGGITQHVAAYQVEHNGQLITFIDTPGHQAFTEMRARGAKVTDIVVLVVAADDGVMPQTVEAIDHAKAAGVQILVAVNKIDKRDARPERVRQQLMEHGLVPEEYGGDTLFVNMSARRGDGVEELLDDILLLAEMAEYRANPDRHAEGRVLEARVERGKGPVATLIVQQGTLRKGDAIVLGCSWGRVRAMTGHDGSRLKEAGPSTPVEIMGLEGLPEAGDHFVVVKNEKAARELAEHRAEERKRREQAQARRVRLEDLLSRAQEDEVVELKLVVKADVQGTLEAMRSAVSKIDIEGTRVTLLHSGVGAITESDVTLAHTYDGIIVGFNVRPDSKARKAVERYGVEVRTYRVIYEALEDIEKALKGMLAPEYEEKVRGLAEVRQTFRVPKVGTVAGCYVLDGTVSRNHKVRLLREGTVVWEGRLASLKRFKDDVREVEKGYECGMRLEGFDDVKIGDQLEFYTEEVVERE